MDYARHRVVLNFQAEAEGVDGYEQVGWSCTGGTPSASLLSELQ